MRLRCRFGIHNWMWGKVETISMVRVEYQTGIKTPFTKEVQKGICECCGISKQRDVS